MTPQEALKLLDANVAQLTGTRENHVALQQAVAVLKKLIEDTEIKKPKS